MTDNLLLKNLNNEKLFNIILTLANGKGSRITK